MTILYAAINAYIDDVPVSEVKRFENDFHRFMEANHPEVITAITDEKDLSEDTEKKLTMAGANKVISPYFISGVRMAAMATQPVAIDFLDIVTHGGLLDFSLFQVTIPTGSPLNGKSIAEADIANASGALVLAIRKSDGSFDLHPKEASQIDANDVLVVLGTQEQFESLQKIVQ